MKYPTIFHLISAVCKEKKVSCILIGGFAVNHYKVSRSTADVDFLITKDNYEEILGLLEKSGLTQDYCQETFARLTSCADYLVDVDFMFVDQEVMDKIIKDGKEVDLAGQKFIVPSVRHLIAMKLHAIKYNPQRELKDFLDITELMKANRINIKTNEFKELCLKYATKELYEKILAWMG